MPEYIIDEEIWEKALASFKKQYNKEPEDSEDFANVTMLYQKMGGGFDKEAFEIAKNLMGTYEFRLSEMAEGNNFQESLIPSFVWKFVKSIIKNPITAGILAMIIYHFVKKYMDKRK